MFRERVTFRDIFFEFRPKFYFSSTEYDFSEAALAMTKRNDNYDM